MPRGSQMRTHHTNILPRSKLSIGKPEMRCVEDRCVDFWREPSVVYPEQEKALPLPEKLLDERSDCGVDISVPFLELRPRGRRGEFGWWEVLDEAVVIDKLEGGLAAKSLNPIRHRVRRMRQYDDRSDHRIHPNTRGEYDEPAAANR